MKPSVYFYALLTGIINSAVGSGGGMISVPLMKKYGLDQKTAQATTIAVILPLTVISATIYALNGDYSPVDSLRYIPFGLLGSAIGVTATEKIKNKMLKIAFSCFMIWSGIQMLIR